MAVDRKSNFPSRFELHSGSTYFLHNVCEINLFRAGVYPLVRVQSCMFAHSANKCLIISEQLLGKSLTFGFYYCTAYWEGLWMEQGSNSTECTHARTSILTLFLPGSGAVPTGLTGYCTVRMTEVKQLHCNNEKARFVLFLCHTVLGNIIFLLETAPPGCSTRAGQWIPNNKTPPCSLMLACHELLVSLVVSLLGAWLKLHHTKCITFALLHDWNNTQAGEKIWVFDLHKTQY